MSSRKPKPKGPIDKPQDIYDKIHHILLKAKPLLASVGANNRSSVLKDLDQVASLAHALCQARSGAEPLPFADDLDLEGVNLWNASTLIRGAQHADAELFAALRLAGYRLIVAGMDRDAPPKVFAHMLELSSKVGSALAATGANDVAGSVLTEAAEFEKLLHSEDVPQDATHKRELTHSIVLYYASRMETAWNQGREGVAFWMLGKIVDAQQTATISSHDLHLIAAKVLDIGKAIMRGHQNESENCENGSKALDAIKWIQIAFTLVEKTDDEVALGTNELKSAILRNLARAYYVSASVQPDNLHRAEAALKELLSSLGEHKDKRSAEYKQLRWMSLAVSKRRRSSETDLFDIFRSIIDNIDFTDGEVQDVLLELRVATQDHFSLVTSALRHFLRHALDTPAGHPFVDKLLMSLIFHNKGDIDQSRAIKDIADGLDAVARSESFELEKLPATACLTLLWKFGDMHYTAKQWREAAEWFLLGTQDALHVIKTLAHSKCLRKAALCYIQLGEYAKAGNLVKQCPKDEAPSHYLAFIIAVHQGIEEEATRAIQEMILTPDFDCKMLLLATNIAIDSKNVLHAVLAALLKTIRGREEIDLNLQAVPLTRCLIRLVLDMMNDPASDRTYLSNLLSDHFDMSLKVIEEAKNKNNITLFIKDISWLWRAAYNAAVEGLGHWSDLQVARVFDMARQLMDAYCDASLVDPEKEVYTHRVMATFSCISGEMFAMRGTDDSEEQRRLCQNIIVNIKSLKRSIQIAKEKCLQDEVSQARLQATMHSTFVYEAEVLATLKEWDTVLSVVKAAAAAKEVSVGTYEAIADVLWSYPESPVPVIYTALECILASAMQQETMSISKFSRWMRAICSILLSKNRPTDRVKALSYMGQAVEVLKDHAGHAGDLASHYPEDERHWLLSTAFNTGVECLSAMSLDEAKQWFEIATVLCKFLEGGEAKRQKIQETYQELLARYAPS